MFSKKVKISLAIIVALTVMIVLMVMQKKDVSQIKHEIDAKYVTTSLSKKGSYSPMHSVIGKIESNSVLNVKSEVNAKVENVLVKSGDYVKQGQLLIELDDKEAKRELDRLQAQLEELNAQIQIQQGQHQLDQSFLEFDLEQLNKAKENYDREKKLLAKQLISNSRFEQVELELNQAQRTYLQRELAINNQSAQSAQLNSSLRQLQITIDVAKENLDAHLIKAQFNGQIGQLNLKIGQQVSIGQDLLVLFNDQSRLFELNVASKLAKEKEAKLLIGENEYSILSVDPLLGAQSAGQKVVFDISGQELALGSYQYAYWLSDPIKESFLIDPKALFEYERVYYLKEIPKENIADSDNQVEEQLKVEASKETKEDNNQQLFELQEAKVKLHGINIVDDKEYWVATSEQLPDESLLLTSKLRNIYSGIKVTNALPQAESKSNEDELTKKEYKEKSEKENDQEMEK